MFYRFYMTYGIEFILLFFFLSYVLQVLFPIKSGARKSIYLLVSTLSFTVLYNLPRIFSAFFQKENGSSFSIPYPYRFTCAIIVSLLFAHWMLEGNLALKLFYILLFENVIQEFKVVCSPLYNNAQTMNRTLYMLLDFGTTIILLLLLLLLSRLFRTYKLQSTIRSLPKTVYLIFYFPVSFFAVYILGSSNISIFQNFAPVISVVILTNIPIIYVFLSIILRSLEKQQQLDLALQQANAQLSRFRFSMEIQKQIKKERHELQNKYFYIRALLEEKEYDQLSAFLDREIGTSIESLFEISSGNALMDCILNQKIQDAHRLNIKTYTEVMLPEQLSIVDDGFCSILLNLLENAIEASSKEKDPDIHIILKCSGNYLVLKVLNKCSRNILAENPELKSSKENPDNHGLGIAIITENVRKKDGIIHFEMDDMYFKATVMLPLAF